MKYGSSQGILVLGLGGLFYFERFSQISRALAAPSTPYVLGSMPSSFLALSHVYRTLIGAWNSHGVPPIHVSFDYWA